LDGKTGYIFCRLLAIYEYLSVAKYSELVRAERDQASARSLSTVPEIDWVRASRDNVLIGAEQGALGEIGAGGNGAGGNGAGENGGNGNGNADSAKAAKSRVAAQQN
jgi:hypothetical protein